MKNNIVISLGLGFAILALVALGFFVVRPVLAQVVATSTELLLGTTTPTETIDSATASTTEPATANSAVSPEPTVLGTSTSTAEESAATTTSDTTAPPPTDTASTTTSSPVVATSTAEPPVESVQVTTESSLSVQTEASTTTAVSADSLVEVKLQCRMSYTATLYNTPSGHLEAGYFIGEASASTTGMIAAHEIGEQSWTKCYDAQGKEYEFKLTPEEYDSFKIRGTPQKSVMLPAADAALAAFE